MKILITGGARSGKSRHAQEIAQALGPRRVYVATAEPLDEEMRDRILRHRAERGDGWTTIEEPVEVAALLSRGDVVLLDCLTLWVSNLLVRKGEDADLTEDFDRLTQAIRDATNHLVIVTNEVGLGIVPASPLSRRFRDLVGTLSQQVAASCTRVDLMCAGIPVQVK